MDLITDMIINYAKEFRYLWNKKDEKYVDTDLKKTTFYKIAEHLNELLAEKSIEPVITGKLK